MREPKSVALIEPVGGHGGMDHYDIGLCRGLISEGWSVSWYTCAETKDPAIQSLRFSPFYRGIWGKAARWTRALRYLVSSLHTLAAAIRRKEKLCHLQFFNGATEELLLLCLAKVALRKIVLTVHDIESFGNAGSAAHQLVSRAYRLADALVIHNAVSKRELERVIGTQASKVVILPHGNYLDMVRNLPDVSQARNTLRVQEDQQVVLFFGQIKDVKGLDLLLKALPDVAQAFPRVLLMVAGRPWKSDFSSYESLIDSLKLRQLCDLHIRYIPDDEVALFYEAADIVVLPYRHIYQSGVVLLSMSFGKPVLVSDIPGMTEIISDGFNGYVFQSDSAPELAKALIRVLGDREGRARMAENALSYVKEKHDWLQIGKRTADVYSSILK